MFAGCHYDLDQLLKEIEKQYHNSSNFTVKRDAKRILEKEYDILDEESATSCFEEIQQISRVLRFILKAYGSSKSVISVILGSLSWLDDKKKAKELYVKQNKSRDQCSEPESVIITSACDQSPNDGEKRRVSGLYSDLTDSEEKDCDDSHDMLKVFDERMEASRLYGKKPSVEKEQELTDSSQQQHGGPSAHRCECNPGRKSTDSSRSNDSKNSSNVKVIDGKNSDSNDNERRKPLLDDAEEKQSSTKAVKENFKRLLRGKTTSFDVHEQSFPRLIDRKSSSKKFVKRYDRKKSLNENLSRLKEIDCETRVDPYIALVDETRDDRDIALVHEAQDWMMQRYYDTAAVRIVAANYVKDAIIKWSTKKVRLKLFVNVFILWPHGRDGHTIYATSHVFLLKSQQLQHKTTRCTTSCLQFNKVIVRNYDLGICDENRSYQFLNDNQTRHPLNTLRRWKSTSQALGSVATRRQLIANKL
uniref:Uncharacterized protein n=1 Tax=Panagrolaimus sp. ES5 TaxID=591445 RepID=A0AC34F4A7_9BILA